MKLITQLAKATIGLGITMAIAHADPLLDQAERIAKGEEAAKVLPSHVALSADMSDVEIKKALDNFNTLKWTHILPVNDLIMVENQHGEHLLMDSNARIAIRGQIEVFDMWNKRPIKTKSDAQSSWLVTLDTFNINPGELASFRYGLQQDKPDVTLLIDPKGDYNDKLFDQIIALGDKYSFEIILAPLLGNPSVLEAMKLWCSLDREKSLQQLMSSTPATGQILPNCDREPIIRSVGLAGILHLTALPHLIRFDGLQNIGAPDSILEFMNRETKNLGEIKTNDAKTSK